jgi:O-phosphoseryl-tRNA synthetase
MTAGWFLTLSEVQHRYQLPIRLFSIDRVFRREQKEDRYHLRSHHSASCVVMGPDVGMETGKEIAKKLLKKFGFHEVWFRKKKVASRYYLPDSEVEVYIKKGREIEVADFGLYSPDALKEYKIRYPVVNLGLGVERLALAVSDSPDLRILIHPWRDWKLSDEEIVEMVEIELKPESREGKQIMEAIIKTCEAYGEAKSPCEYVAWEGWVKNRKVKVYVYEPEQNTKLCGPAYLNEIIVKEGNILAVPERAGISTGIRFIDAFASEAAYFIEKAEEDCELRKRIIRSPSDINVKVDEVAIRYITSKHGKIDVRGPFFTRVRAEVR